MPDLQELWEDGNGRTLVVPSLPLRTRMLEHRVVVDQTGLPLRHAPTAAIEYAAVQALVEPQQTIRHKEDRAFWQGFIDSARFDHPDQPPPRHGGRNWVKIDMPAPARWLTAYRTTDGSTGLFLALAGEAGEVAWHALEAEKLALEEELGLPVQFRIEHRTPFSGQILMQRQAEDAATPAELAMRDEQPGGDGPQAPPERAGEPGLMMRAMLALAAIKRRWQVAGSLSIRNVDDELIARLKRRAARRGQSAEAEMRDILRQVLDGEADGDFERLAADLRRLTTTRAQTPAEVLQRESRNER